MFDHVLPSLRTKTAHLLTVAAFLSALVLIAPHAAAAQGRLSAPVVDNGTLNIAVGTVASDLDPASDEGNSSDIVARALAEELVTFNGSHIDQFKPSLATSWQTNADHSIWTFHLRHGVPFHTGRCCLTADDVRYSIARTILAKLAASYVYSRFLAHPLQQITAPDPYTVRFNLGHPQYAFLNALASQFTGLILDATALRAHATKSDPWAHTWATDHDAGTGPYTLQSWQHGQQEVLTRFAAYWGGWSGPHFSTVIVRTVPDAATRRELLERGQADLTFGLTPQDYQALSKNPTITVSATPGTVVDYLIMTEAGPLASPLARQALSYAFNYNAYLTATGHGYSRRGYGCLASTLAGYDAHMFHYQTDLAKARALLAQAGVKPGTTLTMAYNTGGGTASTTGLLLQAQLAQLGLTLKIQAMTDEAYFAVFFGAKPLSQRPNFMTEGWYPDYNDPWDECVPLVASYEAGAAGANAGYYHNARVDALLAEMKFAPPEVLIRDAHELQDITSRLDPPAIWLDEPDIMTVTLHRLKGYIYNPLEVNTYNFYAFHR